MGEVAKRVRAAGWDTCVVISENRVVAGRLRHTALDGDGPTSVEDVMQAGLTTIRADTVLEEIAGRLRDRNIADILVTTPEGELIGLLRREDPR